MKLTKGVFLLLALLLAVGFAGCSKDEDNGGATGPTATDYYADIADIGIQYFNTGTKNITAAALYEDMTNDVELFIIDYRSADHFALGHIEGAHNWAIGDLMDNLGEIPAGAKVINVCYTGQTASQATAILRLLDYDAYNLLWGMCGWTSDESVNLGKWNVQPGGQTLSTDATPATTTYEVPEALSEATTVGDAIMELADAYYEGGTKNISAASVFELLNDGDDSNDPYVVNYWPESQYLLGHIPGAYMVEPGTLSLDVLATLPTDRQIVVYCYTGQTSSQLTPFLRVLGYDVYSMLFGINSITDDPTVTGGHSYSPPATDYPVVTDG